ncbi:class F sortase [Thermocrispum municipale]|jgi:LPXTG-site transpeptidase (sortase) family protein|uniref:class F sortase n=1 Tax=Thermocrispum municipale TaxID=37926 RepID=UPI0004017888|nr:class F sortase [Thermocrispum municipale]
MSSTVRQGRYRRGLAALVLALAWVSGCSTEPPQNAGPPAGASTREAPPVKRAVTNDGMPPSQPVSVSIPRIGARSSLEPVGLNADGTVEVPPVTEPMQAAWYRHSPTPGEVGPSVLLGHVDGGGRPGIFFRLRELKRGDEVIVERQDGSTATFVVQRVQQVRKDEFPTDEVYGDTEAPEIRLITCGGVFDHRVDSYRDNIIVYGTLRTR